MLYFDSSALISFILEDVHSSKIINFLANTKVDSAFTSIITHLEFESSLQRRLNTKEINSKIAEQARFEFNGLRKILKFISFDEHALRLASHVQKIYGLRPGDAIQLAAGLICQNSSPKVTFLCFDNRLSFAAQNEAFEIL